MPALLRAARRAGIRVLPGTDPLPFALQVRRVASYGFVLSQQFELDGLADGIRQAIRNLPSQPVTFGSCNSLFGFLRDQIALRLARRRS
jgi:hypothetical protein